MASSLLNGYTPAKISVVPNSRSYGICRKHPWQMGGSTRLAIMAEANRENQAKQNQIQKQRIPSQFSPLGVMWDPFSSSRNVRQMIDTMDRVVDDSLSYPPRPRPENLRGGRTPWDVVDKESEIRMRFDMPGMPKEAVNVAVEDNVLKIKAEHPKEEKEEERWSNTSYAKYFTRIPLPENCRAEQINAELKDGVLYVTIPKAKEDPKVISINVH